MSVRKRNKEATEAALVKAAVQVFRRDGYAKARVSDIVGACGLAQGTFYLYFKSKEQMLKRIIGDFVAEVNQALEDVTLIFGGETGEEVLRNLTRFIKKMLLVYQRNLAAAEVIWREGSAHGGVFGELAGEIYADFLQMIGDRMNEAKEKGLIRADYPEDGAVFLVSAFERSSFYLMVQRGRDDIDEMAAGMSRFLLYGMLPKKKSQPGNP